MDAGFKKELDRCTRCGKCRSVCPVFAVTLHEADVARGRLFLAGRLDGEPSRGYLDALARCLLCGACADQCPASVPVVDLIREARSHHRANLLKHLVFQKILPHASRLGQAARAGRAALVLGGKSIPEQSGLRLRAGVDRLLGDRRIPPPPQEDFLTTRGTHTRQHEIALFAGCTTNYLMPQIGHAALSVLANAKIPVDVPADQACCGLMAYGAGDDQAALACARTFLQVFGGYRTILSTCASCTAMLKHQLPKVLPEALDLAGRVVDIHSFLLDHGYRPKASIDPGLLPVSYHAPCHYRFADKEDAPLRLIKSIPGIEMADLADHCCGFGGSFSLANPKLSASIAAARSRQIEQAGARTVITSCSGCLLGLYDSVRSFSRTPQVHHPLILLAGLRGGGERH